MSEENTTTSTETTTETSSATTAPAPQVQDENTLPQWARDRLTKANNEAASYRIAARDAKEAALKEVSAELSALRDEKAAIQAESDRYHLGLMKVEAALGVGIPGESMSEFTSRLRGNTLEELQADAEQLKSLFGVQNGRVRPVDPSQGQGGGVDSNDPATAFEQFFKERVRARG